MSAVRYGVDIGKVRTDDWDKMLIGAVAARTTRGLPTSVLEIGCGSGAQAVRLAKVGAMVQAVDIADYAAEVVSQARVEGVVACVRWQQSNISSFIRHSDQAMNFTYVCMQRVLHYVSYDEAQFVLRTLVKRTTDALYLSVTGTTSAIATYHPLRAAPLPDRFALLSPVGQELFSITAPLCPYSEAEITALLIETGWQIQKIRTSDFGNVKVVATVRGV